MPRVSKFSYIHRGHLEGSSSQAIDIHEISMSRSWIRVLLSYFSKLLLIVYSCYLFIVQEKIYDGSMWCIFAIIIFAKFLHYNPVNKESILIMREFGVQLETHYWSGKVTHRFVPIGKILRPVLNECVSPLTCYWSLSLILHGEEQLMLVFQDLKPSLSILVPVWKSLCAVTDQKASSS